MRLKLALGQFVTHPSGSGIGQVGGSNGESIRIDYFESIAEPVADSQWVKASECELVILAEQTRVFWLDASTGVWRAGRVAGGGPGRYYVRLPNSEFDFPLAEADLRVRWERPIRHPEFVLASGGNETGYFRDARLPMMKNLIEQRAACASIPALLSSAIEIYPHQVRAALTVLSDPVQRYLLADEVGLGKTIEAGLVVRQILLDNPTAHVAILTPASLRRQWLSELLNKFFIDDFRQATIKLLSHDTPDHWVEHVNADLVIVDEVHQLVQAAGPDEPKYQKLARLTHAVPRLLLLSATPEVVGGATHLGLLHLLDPDLYKWNDREEFEARYARRKDLARNTYMLSADFVSMLPRVIDNISEVIPEDPRFRELAASCLALLDEEGEVRAGYAAGELADRVEALRGHVSETYRLHRRVIRHRRARVLVEGGNSDQIPYEVRGRTAPLSLITDCSANAAVNSALLAWQGSVRDRLANDGRTHLGGSFAEALAVLVSRAGGVAHDFVDAARWRIERDLAAADRAQLTIDERTMLAGGEVFEFEAKLFESLNADLAEIDEQADWDRVIDALLPVLRRRGRTVVFCGPGSFAGQFASRLRTRFPKAAVAEASVSAGLDASQESLEAWQAADSTRSARILVVDDSAEDGLNLQVADAVVHCRLPWSPNRLEQRLGRVDRYRGPESIGQPLSARQYVLTDGAGDDTFGGSWLTLLERGFHIFTESVSALQDSIAQGTPVLWSQALAAGPAALADACDEVRESLAAERREVESMDMLESINESVTDLRDIAADVHALEARWRETRDALLGYAGNDAGGLRFSYQTHRTPPPEIVTFRLTSAPLIPSRLFHAATSRMRPAVAAAAFNRSAAISASGTRLFRIGNPFIDMLAKIIELDDRGQAAAFRRFDPAYHGGPEAYFGFDYLVEASTNDAAPLVTQYPGALRALRRQADRLLPPFTMRIWVAANDLSPIVEPERVAWLDRPYAKDRGDLNFNATRREELLDIFDGTQGFARSIGLAQNAAGDELEKAAELTKRCQSAERQARQSLAVARAQALARHAAGRLVADSESYLTDVAITAALTKGLSQPHIRVTGAACIVRTGLVRRRRDQ